MTTFLAITMEVIFFSLSLTKRPPLCNSTQVFIKGSFGPVLEFLLGAGAVFEPRLRQLRRHPRHQHHQPRRHHHPGHNFPVQPHHTDEGKE